MGPPDKKRLHVVTFVTNTAPSAAGHDRGLYHWALCVGPKAETPANYGKYDGMMYHVVDEQGRSGGRRKWTFQARPITSGRATSQSIGRITIGKILKPDEIDAIIRSVVIPKDGNPEWRCRHFVIDAVNRIAAYRDVIGTSVDLNNWDAIQRLAEEYGHQKKQEGRFGHASKEPIEKMPTFDMVRGKEVVK